MSYDWNDARLCDSICYDLKLADYPRGLNRSLLNDLYNGLPPYTEDEVKTNAIDVNVNFLEGTRLLHDARAQFAQNFLKPGKYFTLTSDAAPVHKRDAFNTIVTTEMNRIMKRSLNYFETMRSKFGLLVLHGISPAVWQDQERWCPKCIGVEDALVPANTLLGFDNLPFIVAYRSFTAYELRKLTDARNRDPGWNMKLVNSVIDYIDKQGTQLMGTNWPEVWSPEKTAERVKSDGGFYASDQLPTIDCFDIYAYDDSGKESKWIRRIILDAWGNAGVQANGYSMPRRSDRGDLDKIKKADFLYTSGNHRFADSLQNIFSFQFADLSAVAPFRYHSVRSLGFLQYAVCHLQNRLRCKFNEAVFEQMMMYFRVKSADDVQHALKVELANKGFIEEGVTIVPAAERFQLNSQLVELGLGENKNLITENASSSTQNANFSRDRVEKTRFQVMAEVNASTALLSAAVMQATQYQYFEYAEIKRRFMRPNSKDPDVREFRAACMKKGVSAKLLVPEAWEVHPERVMGAGNKTLEMAVAEQLMNFRPLYDPSAQRMILRDVTTAITDDPAKAEALVPEQPQVSNSIHDAQLAAGSLMQGLPVAMKDGINLGEYAQALLADMAMVIGEAQKNGGMVSPEKLKGLNMMGQHVQQVLTAMEPDQSQKQLVRQLGDQLGKLNNFIKAFTQRLAEAMKAQQQQNGNGIKPEDMAKLELEKMRGQQKIDQSNKSHAAKTAQRKVQFEQQQQQEAERSRLQVATETALAGIDIAKARASASASNMEE
jgi:hypothetical protein